MRLRKENMRELHNLDLRLEKAVILGLELPEIRGELEASLQELTLLAETAGVEVVDRLTQKRKKIDASYYVGKGKAQEARELIRQTKANLLLVDDDLTPAQQRNLEKIVKVRVVDRTELILAIFAWRARTHQAKVQVELARMEYSLPRLRKMWTHLVSEQEKGVAGLRAGAGERQIELDRRYIKKRITDLKRELDLIRKRKARTMRNRAELFTIALVGYTNAGKSTLMNALTGANVFVEDKLFATLDTRTRIWKLAAGHKCLLSDTVGFIKRLPHHLVEAFHATLREAITADLLLLVADVASAHVEEHIEAVNKVLKEIDCEKIPTIILFNKVDLLADRKKLDILQTINENSLAISAKTGKGINELKNRVLIEMRKSWIPAHFEIALANGKLIGILKEETEIRKETYRDGYICLDVFFDPRIIRKIEDAAQKGDIIEFEKPSKLAKPEQDFYVPPA